MVKRITTYSGIGLLARTDPPRARREILRAFREEYAGDTVVVARHLGVTRRTLDRLVIALGLEATVERVRAAARRRKVRAA